MYQKSWYDLQFLRYRVWQTEIGDYKSFFAPPLLKSQKSRILKKWKKILEISSFYVCTKNHNQMRCSSWDMEWDRHNFLSFWAIFCTFTPLLTPKIKIWKKAKKTPWDIILLHMCTINEDHTMYGSWDKKTQQIVFCHFRPFCALLHTSHPKNQNFEKKPGNIILHLSDTNDNHMMYGSWDMEHKNDLVVKTLNSQSKGPMFKTTGWLLGRHSLSSIWGR